MWLVGFSLQVAGSELNNQHSHREKLVESSGQRQGALGETASPFREWRAVGWRTTAQSVSRVLGVALPTRITSAVLVEGTCGSFVLFSA